MVQWLRIRFTMQGMWIWSLVREPGSHLVQGPLSLCASTTEPKCSRARVLQLEKTLHTATKSPLTTTKMQPNQFSSVQLLSRVRIPATPWTAAHQASLSITNSWSLPKIIPLSRWCHPTISSSVVPFSSCPQSFPASRSFQMSQLFTSGGQSMEQQTGSK